MGSQNIAALGNCKSRSPARAVEPRVRKMRCEGPRLWWWRWRPSAAQRALENEDIRAPTGDHGLAASAIVTVTERAFSFVPPGRFLKTQKVARGFGVRIASCSELAGASEIRPFT